MRQQTKTIFWIIVFISFMHDGFTQVRLPKLFSNNMVLQQNANPPIWGWANPQDTIEVTGSWNQQKIISVADSNGKWMTNLQTPEASFTAYEIVIKGLNTITISDVLIGEVWLLSGQSNMEMKMQGFTGSPIQGSTEALATANFPFIRLLTVDRKNAGKPQTDIVNNPNNLWQKCNPGTAKTFSAVGFFFGRELFRKLNVPIGLVCSAWGGSSCETWAEKSSLDFVEDFAGKGPWSPTSGTDNKTASVLFNGMIAPLVPFSFSGVCWYQGETNVGRPEQLTSLFPSMIEGWRNAFKKANLPFYFVQLAPYGGYGDGALPVFWEAQANALTLQHTQMAETLDLGDETDIHPAKKEPIGYRFAKKALANVYGWDTLVYSGPVYDSLKIENSKIRLFFTHTGSGLKTVKEEPEGFEIAGSNNIYYPAKAEIQGNEVVVYNPQISNPKNVRYAWSKNAGASLFNIEGFPAPPFRTHQPDYIKSLAAKVLISTNLIHEGEPVLLRWFSRGANAVRINGEPKNLNGSEVLLPDSTSYLVFEANNETEHESSLKKIYVIPKEYHSWANKKNVASSSLLNSKYPAQNAVDENMETQWRSQNSDNQWLSLDLGEPVPVNLVIIHWGDNYGRIYEIEVSDDNLNWTSIFKEFTSNGDMDFIAGLNSTTRYIRIKGIERRFKGSRTYEIKEFKVYSSEFRKTGTLLDEKGLIMRGTPMVLGKQLQASADFARSISNWQTIKNNGFNTVRVCWVDPWYKNRNHNHWTVEEVMPFFDKCVENAMQTGMNIIINYHGVGEQQYYDTTYTFELEKEFWDSIAPRYRNNPLVYYEIANEPTFRMSDYLKPEFKNNLLEIYNAVREKAPERQILMFSFNTIRNEILEVVEAYKSNLDWDYTSVAYHMYNSTTSEAVKKLMPYHRVICTEWNYDHVSKKEGFEYIRQVDGFKENSETLEKLKSSWIDWRNWNDTTLNELLDTLIYDAKLKNYWWGKPSETIDVSGVKVFPDSVKLHSGASKQLIAFVTPALAGNQKISWKSLHPNLVTHTSDGKITSTATQEGFAIIEVSSEQGSHKDSCVIKLIAPEEKGGYPDNSPHSIPGTINPTHYDLGGEGIGYHDKTNENTGNGIRPDQGVDTGYLLPEGAIEGIETGEWLEYTIDVETEGNYNFIIQFTSLGYFGQFHIEINGTDVSGIVYALPSGNNAVFRETIVENIPLNKGIQVFRLYFDYAFYNLGNISIERIIPTATLPENETSKIRMFPNPTKKFIKISGISEPLKFTIQSISGQLLHSGILPSDNTLFTGFLHKGNYILTLTGKQFSVSKKIIKL